MIINRRENYTLDLSDFNVNYLINTDKLKKYLDANFNENLPFNYHKGHYQIHLPKSLDYLPEEILFNLDPFKIS